MIWSNRANCRSSRRKVPLLTHEWVHILIPVEEASLVAAETTHLQRPSLAEVGNISAVHAQHSGEIDPVRELEPRHIVSIAPAK